MDRGDSPCGRKESDMTEVTKHACMQGTYNSAGRCFPDEALQAVLVSQASSAAWSWVSRCGAHKLFWGQPRCVSCNTGKEQVIWGSLPMNTAAELFQITAKREKPMLCRDVKS